MRIWKTLFYFLSILPWTFIASLLTFYFKAGQLLGHAPSYNNPDPKELDIYKVYAPYVYVTAEMWLCSLLVWFALVIIYLIIMRKRIEWTPVVMSGIGQTFGILLFLSGINEWFID